ncbi:MAG TPA: hypothetical protein VMT46_19405 [Anaerolineaceae bacterium]|nr:hypothetical protein [Anaerolineaceae bacterium]
MNERELIERAAERAGCQASQLLAWQIYPDRLVIVVADGRKLSFTLADIAPAEAASPPGGEADRSALAEKAIAAAAGEEEPAKSARVATLKKSKK